jgi:hypothetical protein
MQSVHPVLAIVFLCVGLAGCGSVLQSARMELESVPARATACAGEVGSYFLAKGELDFKVAMTKAGDQGYYTYDLDSTKQGDFVAITTDRNQAFCTQYNSNIATSDVILIQHENDLPILKKVYSNVDDQSDDIVKDVASGVALSLANINSGHNRSFADENGTSKGDIRQFRFDPFDRDLLKAVNQSLKPVGYCVFIDPAGDPLVPGWMAEACPGGPARPVATEDDVYPPPPVRVTEKRGSIGIYYKPFSTHTLAILKRDDPTSGMPWRVWLRQSIAMPNLSPVFEIEVKRGFFADRTTQIDFKNGALAGVKIEKKSELSALAGSVLNIVAIGVRIPAKALIISTNQAENNAKIIEANQALLEHYRKVQKDRDELQKKYDALTPAQKDQVDDAGARSGRSDATPSLSRQACFDNAALSNPEEAADLCGSPPEQ